MSDDLTQQLLRIACRAYDDVLLEGALLRGIVAEPAEFDFEYGVGPFGTEQKPFAIVRDPDGRRKIVDVQPTGPTIAALRSGVKHDVRIIRERKRHGHAS